MFRPTASFRSVFRYFLDLVSYCG